MPPDSPAPPSSPARTRPTLESVAQAAKVSRQTVSNALNSPQVVRRDTLDRVLAAVDALGYRPLIAARQLRTRRSHTVAMRLDPARDGINGAVLDRFLHAFVEGAQGAGYRVLLFTADDDAGELETFGDLLATADLDGFLLTATHHGDPRTRWLGERSVPYSSFGRPWGSEEEATPHWVDVDGAAGTRAAVQHLLARGHHRIAFLGWPAGSGAGDHRRAGWAEALDALGLDRPGSYDVAVADSIDGGRHAAAGLLGLPEPPTAIVCASDSLALGALGAIGGAGTAPGLPAAAPTTAVVGFDDTPVATAVGLTSVAQPLAEAARACLGQLLAQIEPDAQDAPPLLLSPRLVVRRSS